MRIRHHLAGITAWLTAAVLGSAALLGIPAAADDLTEVLVSTYRNNPRLMAERARVRELDENFVQVRGQGRLTGGLNATAAPTILRVPNQGFFGEEGTGSSTSTVTPKQVGLQLIQPLYQGGRVKFGKRQAVAGVLSARESLRNTEQSLFVSAANAYVDVRRDEETARIRRNNVNVLMRQKEASTARFDVGEGTRTDIAQSDTRLAQARIGLAQAEAQLQSSRATFLRLVGTVPAQLEPVPPFALPATLEAAQGIARDNNPQLLASYFNEQAAEAAIEVAKSAGRPTLSLQGQSAVLRDQLNALNEAETASITANLTIPLFAGGINRSRVRQAKHARTRIAFESRDTELAVDQTVAQLWAQLDAARTSLSAARTGVAAAEVAFEGVELERQVGTRTALDVLDAEQELLNAQLSVVDAQRTLDQTTFQLLATMGTFDAWALQLPVDYYDPKDHFRAAKYEGLDEFVDTYVPVAARKIGAQLDDLVESGIEGVGGGLDALSVTDLAEGAGKGTLAVVEGVALGTKGVLDTVTFQNRDLKAVEDMVIDGEPATPEELAPSPLPQRQLVPGTGSADTISDYEGR